MSNQKIYDELLKLSYKAIQKNEVPVACIIVKDDKIVAKAYNMREKYKNPLYHAEIICINKLCKKIKNWRLDDYQMYVTLKPCKMCLEVIKASRIKKVFYILDNINEKNNITLEMKKIHNNDSKFKKILTSFFKSKR
jgi:tRNA(adenine34) deaminase